MLFVCMGVSVLLHINMKRQCNYVMSKHFPVGLATIILYAKITIFIRGGCLSQHCGAIIYSIIIAVVYI